MENIAFIAWLILWPIGVQIGALITAKRRQITGESEASEDARACAALVVLVIWGAVGALLYS